ncbi:uroporphyrinogen-III synthase [Bacteroidales bacterium]|nr:uroporphyrinogen-III synthase [Bacteroidales bacterium]
MKIKKILVSQPKPTSEKSPYFDLAAKHNLKIDFRPFIQVEGISSKEFRIQKIDILDYTAVLFTSKHAVNNYFRIAEELRIEIPDSMKYFCQSESIALYLQKYIVYRKRKIFFGEKRFAELVDVVKKHTNEKYLVPVSDQHKAEISKLLDAAKIEYTKAIYYRTVSSDLSDLSKLNYDVLVFFSPSGVKSLLQNFPQFEQNNTRIASFGANTTNAVKEAGLRVDIEVPKPETPSMSMALECYIQQENKKKK